MKNKIIFTLFISCLILLTSCKTRKVAITKVDSTSVKKSNVEVNKVEKHVDTTKTVEKKIVIVSDSGHITTTIIPSDTGISKVSNGVFIGKAKSIVISKTYKKDKSVDSNKAIDNGLSTDLKQDSTASKQDSTSLKKSVKTVDAQADHSWVWAVLGVVALVLIGGFVYFKYIK